MVILVMLRTSRFAVAVAEFLVKYFNAPSQMALSSQKQRSLPGLLLGTINNIELLLLGKLTKVGTVAGYPDQ